VNVLRTAKLKYSEYLLQITKEMKSLDKRLYSNNHENNVKKIRRDFPQPAISEECKAHPLDPVELFSKNSGRDILERCLQKMDVSSKDQKLFIEFGVLFGGSCKRWLSVSETFHILAIDHWPAEPSKVIHGLLDDPKTKGSLSHLSQEQVNQLLKDLEKYGFQQYVINCCLNPSRFTIARAKLPDILFYLYDRKIYPSVMYFDADKDWNSIEIALKLFPCAIICGDDYLWQSEGIENMIPTKLHEFSQEESLNLEVSGNTWILKRKKI
jgi:hypothetical protein